MGKRSERHYRKGAHHAAEAVLAGLQAGAEGVDLVAWAEAVREWREAGDAGAFGAGRTLPPHAPMPAVLPVNTPQPRTNQTRRELAEAAAARGVER